MANANVLLVEGPDDLHMLLNLFKRYAISAEELKQRNTVADIGVKFEGGIEKLLQTFPVWLKSSEVQRLGVIVDADQDVMARWQALRDRLTQAGYNLVPNMPSSSGTIITQPDSRTVGVWIMPDNTLPGMLEDFVRFLVPSDDTLWTKAEQCLQTLTQAERKFSDNHFTKAHLHTWLAWQEEPGRPIGQAITRRYLDANAPQAQQLIDWMRRLFNIPLP